MAFERQVERRVQQRMPGTDKGRQGLALRRNEGFLEGNALVAGQHGLAHTDEAVAVADGRGHVGHLIAARLPLPHGPSELLEGFEEKRLDVVGLQPTGLGAFHLLAHPGYPAGVHGVMRQGALVKQGLEPGAIHRPGNRLRESGAYLRALAIANRLEQEVTQWPTRELELAKHVEDLPTEGRTGLIEFVEQGAVHFAFAGLLSDEVPQVTHLCLANAVDTAEALLQAVGVPRQVIVHHQMGALQVDPLPSRVGGEQHLHLGIVPECLLGLQALLAAHAAVDDNDRLLAPEQCAHTRVEIAQGITVLGEDDQLLAWGRCGCWDTCHRQREQRLQPPESRWTQA